jgi:hypothetical protein
VWSGLGKHLLGRLSFDDGVAVESRVATLELLHR